MKNIEIKSVINETIRNELVEIVDYKPNTDDWEYIKKNSIEIWDFLNNGYKLIGYNKFCGCDSIKSLLKNASLIKIGFFNKKWVAISVYTSYLGGFKNVGITSTIDSKYRTIGVNAVNKIIKTDIKNFDKFFWTECSGAIEHLYEKYNGIKIPNSYASAILRREIELDSDDYHYSRLIKGEKQTKIIYGFNSLETFNKVKSERENYINKNINLILSMQIDESIEKPSFGRLSSIDCYINIIYFFLDQQLEDECYELPESSIIQLRKYITYLKLFLTDCNDVEKKNEIQKAINIGEDIINTSSVMKVFLL